VSWVSYPGLPSHASYAQATALLRGGFGGVLTFGVRGGELAAKAFVANTTLFSLLANVGDAKSLVIHPWSPTHGQLEHAARHRAGDTPDLVRHTVGLEDVGDILADLETALAAAVTAVELAAVAA
jgi:O-acetylhomoserine (thiol)-lyase